MPITIAVCYRIGLTQGISRQTMLLSVQKIPICFIADRDCYGYE